MTQHSLQKINSDFAFTDHVKDYSINPKWKEEYTQLWNFISGSTETIGQAVYESISNFVQNVRDIDTCGLHQLTSIAFELDVEQVFSYNLQYPADLETLMNKLSVQRSYLLTTGYMLLDENLSAIYSDTTITSAVSTLTHSQFTGWIETTGIISGKTGAPERVVFFTDKQIRSLSGETIVVDLEYLTGFLEPTIYANLSTNALWPMDSEQSGIALEYQGFMDHIYSNPSSTFDSSTSADIITECTHTLRNIVIKSSYLREMLKNIAQKHAMIGSTKAIQKLIGEYILRSFTKKQDWRLYVQPSGTMSTDSIKREYKLNSLLPSITTPDPYFFVDVVEYWDDTEYLNISASSPFLCGIVGYVIEPVTTTSLDLSGNIISATTTASVPIYDNTGLCGYMVTGGSDRFWEGDSLVDSILFSEHTSADVSAFYTNIGLSGDFNKNWNLQTKLWDTYSVSGYNHFATIPDLTGTPFPQYDGIDPALLPPEAWETPPTSLSALQYKYIGTISGDAPPANIKNQQYTTIAIQPFLWNLIEKTSIGLANFIIRAVLPSLQSDTDRLSSQVDISGNLIDSWRFQNQEYVGYQTFYEQATNLDFNENYNPDIDRDGPFHPTALSAYIDVTSRIPGLSAIELSGNNYDLMSNEFSGLLSGYFDHIAKGFELSGTMPRVDKQLVKYHDAMLDLSGKIVYQYAFDHNNHHYMLYKDSDDFDAKGSLWCRYHNHPLPFPVCDNLSGDISLSGLSHEFQQIWTRDSNVAGLVYSTNNNLHDFGFYENIMWTLGSPASTADNNFKIFPVQYIDITNTQFQTNPLSLYTVPLNTIRSLGIPVNDFIGTYTYRDYIIIVYADENWQTDISLSGQATIHFVHYNKVTYDYEQTPLQDCLVTNLSSLDGNNFIPFTSSICAESSGNIWHLAVSEDMVTLAFDAVNSISGESGFANSIVTIDLLKTRLGNTPTKTVLEWNRFVDGTLL